MAKDITAESILNAKFAGDLFPRDDDAINIMYKNLVKIWHPDVNKDYRASDVFAKILELHDKAVSLMKDGTWEAEKYVIIKKENDKSIEIYYDTSFDFELGKCYVCKTKVIYLIESDKEKFYNNAITSIKKLHYRDDAMKHEFATIMPDIFDTFKTKEGRYCIVLNKDDSSVPLRTVLEYFDNKLDDRHVAWILSRLYNISCLLKFNGLVHNGINLDSCFISPEYHCISLYGGWWYCVPEDDPMIGTTRDIFSLIPVSAKGSKKATSVTDLESIKYLGRLLLGETNCRKLDLNKSMPNIFKQFLIRGSGDNAYDEFAEWDSTLMWSYGKRKFIKMEIENLYEKKGE